MNFIFGSAEDIWRIASTPSISGIRRSISTMSGLSSLALFTASTPLVASPTTLKSGSRFIMLISPSLTTGWSSAIKMFIGSAILPPTLQEQQPLSAFLYLLHSVLQMFHRDYEHAPA